MRDRLIIVDRLRQLWSSWISSTYTHFVLMLVRSTKNWLSWPQAISSRIISEQEKNLTIAQWPMPRLKQELLTFLGSSGYYCRSSVISHRVRCHFGSLRERMSHYMGLERSERFWLWRWHPIKSVVNLPFSVSSKERTRGRKLLEETEPSWIKMSPLR